MGTDKIQMTYKVLFFNWGFWNKVFETPCSRKKSAYCLMKLKREVIRATKEAFPAFRVFEQEIAEGAGERDKDGKLVPYKHKQIIPNPDPDKKEIYDDLYEKFGVQTVSLKLDKVSLEHFSHLTFTPNEWLALEEVADMSAEALEDQGAAVRLVNS